MTAEPRIRLTLTSRCLPQQLNPQRYHLRNQISVQLRGATSLGFRGIDRDNPHVEIIHRGKYKSLTKQQRRWLKRRQAVEPAIGHLKSDHRMDRCWLKGQRGDALHAVLCASGYNLRWLLRAMLRLGLKAAFLRPVLRALMQFINSDQAQFNSSKQNFRLTGALG